ncbi:MAG: hypothetical protein ACOY4D_02830 [Pseudomonadota bacterium]
MPELIEALRDWVAFSSSILALADEQHRMGEVYSKDTWPDSIVHLYLNRFPNGEEGVYPGFTTMLRSDLFTYNSNDCRKRFISMLIPHREPFHQRYRKDIWV